MKQESKADDLLDFDEVDWKPGANRTAPAPTGPPSTAEPARKAPKEKLKRETLRTADLDFVSDCRGFLAVTRMRWSYAILWLVLVFLIVGIYWASQAELEEVTRGSGKVIPSSSVQVIQSLEGGLIAEIGVREGDVVEKDQVLLRIHDTQFSATYKESVAKVDVLLAKMDRLKAESLGQDAIAFSEATLKNRPDLVKSETELFAKRREDLEMGLETTTKSLELAEREMKMTRPLLDTGAVSEIEVIRLERQINELQGAIRNPRSQFQKRALEEFDAAKAELEALQESIKGYEDRVNRTVIKSPVRGTVNKIHINTVGRVIKAGDDIMEIVPLEDSLLVQADIRPSDIAFLYPGQPAVVKVTAYDFAEFGGLDGKVEQIAVDTTKNEKGESFYQIKVRTEKSSLNVKGTEMPIIPGMVTEVDVLTGKKTVLNYLLKPINRTRHRALRER